MGQKIKTSKGEISISNCDGRIRLRWRYGGNRYSLNLPFTYKPENMHFATVKSTEIKLDIIKGCFDTTLRRYDSPTIEKTVNKKIASLKTQDELQKNLTINELSTKFNDWGKHIRNIDVDNSIDYLYIRKWLERCIDIPVYSIAERLNSENLAVSTYNRRLSYLSTFLMWLVDNGTLDRNPLKNVIKRRDKSKKKCVRRKPLEENEILVLLEAIKNNTYCPAPSQFKHSHYYPFLVFIFYTGVRNAEAIGLKVKHIDLLNNQIEISETFARTTKGANHAARIEKGTKMQNVRYLPLTTELMIILKPLIEMKKQDEYVFKSPRGLTIDDKMLQRRILKPVLLKLGLGDRDLYAARHSFGTRAVQQGMALTDVAYLMGHSTVETAMRNYVSVTRPSKMLPNINKT